MTLVHIDCARLPHAVTDLCARVQSPELGLHPNTQQGVGEPDHGSDANLPEAHDFKL